MNKKDFLLVIFVLIFLLVLWLLNRDRLRAYDECVVIRTTKDWNYPCELGRRGY